MQHVRVWRDRGLQVEDEAEAVHYLTYIGYYRLSGYSRPLMRHGTGEAHKFKEGARFTNILDLYRFDRELRLIMMDAIERIEVAFRTVFSNTMACKYGSHCYLEKKLFLFPDNAEWLARKIMDETGHAPEQKRKRDVFFDHYYQKYSSPRLPPTWMVAEALSINVWSRNYEHLASHGDRKEIARQLGCRVPLLESWMHAICYLRNLCAHHLRVWNREFTIKPMIPKKQHTEDMQRNDRFYASAFAINVLMEKACPRTGWWERLMALIDSKPFVNKAATGFPDTRQKEEN